MRLSEERVAILARRISDNLLDEELIDLEVDEDGFRSLVENLILRDLKIEGEIDEEATAFILKTKPNLEEGSTAWNVELERKKEELSVVRGYVSY